MIIHRFLKYGNKHCSVCPILALMYLIAFPIALICSKIGIKPNLITFFSFLFSTFAFASLCYSQILFFFIFWLIAYLLDFVDGTLARMTNQIRKKALRFDHHSDLIKIFLLFLGFGVYFDKINVWIMCFISACLYLFYTILNHDLNYTKKLLKVTKTQISNKIVVQNENQSTKKVLPSVFIRSIYAYFKGTFLIIHGHTLVIFLIIPIDEKFAVYTMLYFSLILTFQSYYRIRDLAVLPKV